MNFEEYLELAQFRINELASGKYKIGEIYGEYWDDIPNHTDFGVKFKAAVIAGRLTGILPPEWQTDNNWMYTII